MEKVLRQENRQDAGSAGALFSVSDRALISAMEQRGYLAMQGGSCFPAGDINRALTAVRGVTRYEDRARIGNRIKEIREERGIEARDLARLVGIDAANLSRIENGRYSVGLDILAKIATALGKKVDFVDIDQ